MQRAKTPDLGTQSLPLACVLNLSEVHFPSPERKETMLLLKVKWSELPSGTSKCTCPGVPSTWLQMRFQVACKEKMGSNKMHI